MNDEIRFLANMSDSVWGWLGEALDMCAETLRSDVLAAGHTTIGFITTKTLSEAKTQNIHGPQIEGHGTTRNTALKIETW